MEWAGPLDDRCQLCLRGFGQTMYDASILNAWGNVCHTCFVRYNGRLGLGLGQMYVKQQSGKWLCVGGNSEQ
jgi:hypothetical protein